MLDFSYDLTASGGVTSTFRQPNHSSIRGAFMAIHQLPPLGVDSQSLTCKRCNITKPADAFYASDKGRCKECIKSRVRENRSDNLDYYRSYDRMRYREDDERKARCQAMGKTVSMEYRVQKQRERRQADPSKYLARQKVERAVAKGQIAKADNCFFCASSDKLQAHHHDYSKPLDVFWLCPPCHGKLHTINGDFHRPKPNEAL